MNKLFNDTQMNLCMGLRLALFRPCGSNQFAINGDQLAILLIFDLLLNIVFGYLLALPNPVFDLYALPTYCLDQFVFFLLIFIITKLWKNPDLFLTISIMTLSISPLLNTLIYLDRHLQASADEPGSHYQWWGVMIAFYSLLALGRVFYFASGRLKILSAFTLLVVLIAGVLQFRYFGETQQFWYETKDEDTEEKDRWTEYRTMDAEKLMYRQPEILTSALQTLKRQRGHLSDVFFVGFASYATEDVFSKEVVFAKGLLDNRFGTTGHSINLINHLSTRETVPLATATNLAATLKHIGALMDTDEDVLVLYLTSHGSEDHELSVEFWPLALNDITPEKLRFMLDGANIKWRVIIISACYSGGFIKALANDYTLVATAAAADKTSFGCGTQSTFTYFGEAVFKDQLTHEFSLLSAVQQARVAIGQREKRENIEASSPQLSIGPSIKSKLDHLSEEIRLRYCGSPDKSLSC